ncbi:methyl-accepting chemotaxis protein [Flocculibacter collagenilyticus]|uniref:methyl-accepting chemotaxis protein n=1 Tax=Flocculibacter collagenilyticus TaxID=2744479 RepID=UPI0018F5821D|nr:HAMP domain-containing methyl-accepting chemotaxis protein [Flocculibacter collagenilyticus]
MNNISLKALLIASFAIFISLLLISSIVAYNKLSSMQDRIEKIADSSAIKIKLGARINQDAIAVSRAEKNIILEKEQSGMQEYITFIDSIQEDMQLRRNQLRELVDDDGKQKLDEFASLWDEYLAVNKQVINLALAGNNQQAFALSSGKGREISDRATDSIAAIVDINEKALDADKADSIANHSFAVTLLTSILLLSLIIACVVAYFVTNRVSRSISMIIKSTNAIADGNLNGTVKVKGKDEFATINRAILRMRDNLKDTITEISNSATELLNSTSQLTDIVIQTRSNIDIQRENALQAATAMEQMSSTVEKVAADISHSSSSAQQASDKTNSVQQTVSQTSNEIDDLAKQVENSANVISEVNQRSNDINSVTDVIQSVAEQTNLLALNAAIEAARAGEHGRGFSVVADEVRSLASRTQKSTEEINQIIESLQSSSNQASKVIEKSATLAADSVDKMNTTEQSIANINDDVSQISDMSFQISSAAEQQAVVSDEISKNINDIASMSDQNLTGIEETQKISENLQRVTQKLNKLVSNFNY